ncbi:DNA-binding transcriptional LysR family regulator [Paralcaligenes ureilyticus]|uniref:DNA-binding transcriptional LysR family regulator n=1 Tax=Paralcaligenes ureilyticus TaxID=627131 RepID=A0A4R3LVR9_9BURK|nr:DNA-binding transcriptional LysR family regulator [Paralcaligenes ureilyticus]
MLLALEQTGSLRAAAEVLNVTQPALTKALREIEGAFNTTFFTRSQRGVTPTLQGRVVTRGARIMLQTLDSTHREIADVRQRFTSVRLGMPPFVAHGHFPGLMKVFLQSDPPVSARVVEGAVHDLLERLVSGDLDALITPYVGAPVPESACRLVYEPLLECRYVAIVSNQHRFARTSVVDLRELVTDRWIMPSDQSLLRKSLHTAFQLAGVTPPTPVVEVDDPISHINLVAAGIGIGCVATSSICSTGASTVSVLRTRPEIPKTTVAFIFRADDHSDKLELIKNLVSDYFSKTRT